MSWIYAGRRSAIGLDVGPRAVGAVQVIRARSGLRLAAAVRLPRQRPSETLDAQEVERLMSVLDRHGFQGREVVLAVPDRLLRCSALELPPRSSGAPVDQLARMEVARAFKLDPAALELACWDVPGAAQGSSGVLAAALSHADAAGILGPFEAAGFVPVALEPRVCAMARAAAPLTADPATVDGVVDLGEPAAVLAVLQDGVVAYERAMQECGLGSLRAELASGLKLPPTVIDLVLEPRHAERNAVEPPGGAAALLESSAEIIARETRAALDYVARRTHGVKPGKVLLAGPGARIPTIVKRLTEDLGQEIAPLAPGRLAEPPPTLADAGADPALAVALGLALHEES